MSQTLLSKLSLPLIAAPMFLVSGTSLVVASCKKGLFFVGLSYGVYIGLWKDKNTSLTKQELLERFLH